MSDVIRIPLGPNGKVVAWSLIDMADYERIVAYRWYRHIDGYAQATLPEFGRPYQMQIVILERMNVRDGFCIHHVNGDKLDNRRENLRVVTYRENRVAEYVEVHA